MFQSAVNKFTSNPKQLFVIDGFGAAVSAFLLGVVLVYFQEYFGIPKNTLYFLAFLPCLFLIYDIISFKKITKNIGLYLKGIASANLLYAVLSIALAFYHIDFITMLGWGYIIIEILIIVYLAILQLKTANKLG